VLVSGEGCTWEPDTGQFHLELTGRVPPGSKSPLPPPDPDPPGIAGSAADAWYERAVLLEAEAPAEAAEAYRRALQLDPMHADAHVNLGRLLHEDGALALAEAHYRNAMAAEPGNERAWYNLGVALEDQGNPDAAVEAYEEALRLDPDLGMAHFNLSRLFEVAQRPSDALRHLASYKRTLDRGQAPA